MELPVVLTIPKRGDRKFSRCKKHRRTISLNVLKEIAFSDR